MIPSLVITNVSLASVPMINNVLKPEPPSIATGALMLYSIWLLPLPVVMSVCEVADWPVEMMRNARTMNVLLPPSPNSFSVALLL